MTTAKKETDILNLARARDEILDQWLAYCSPEDLALTAQWLLDGTGAAHIPLPLKAAQERLMEEIEKPAQQPQGAE